MAIRRTLAREVSVEGTSLHAGLPARLTLKPAAAGSGIRFRRSDIGGSHFIEALWSKVTETRLGTVIGRAGGPTVALVEHLLAALAGADIDDCDIDVDGPEPPVLDGDALSFLVVIESAGARETAAPRGLIEVLKPVEVALEDASARLAPAAGYELHFEIDFDSAAIGRERLDFVFSPENFRRQIAPARTFGFLRDADRLRAQGFARGASLENTLVLDGDRLMNPERQRFADEFVRHKILDAVGDMKLAGAPLKARFEGRRSSHTLNNMLLRALFADPANFRRIGT